MGERGAPRGLGGIFAVAVFAPLSYFFLLLGSYDQRDFAVHVVDLGVTLWITMWVEAKLNSSSIQPRRPPAFCNELDPH
jgi:hypothetical protein